MEVVLDHSGSHGSRKTTLIFPGGMPRSLEYLQTALSEGCNVIGASSLTMDVSRENYPAWIYLPFITDPAFDAALRQAILELNIGSIFSPNFVVWNCLKRALAEMGLDVTLVNDAPLDTELRGYRVAREHARALLDSPLALAGGGAAKRSMPEIELSALFRHAEVIPGMCDHEKFCVLYEIARRSPAGDIVEIGSWWGKSAFILAKLARCYDIGNLLCVDPWSNDHLVQPDATPLVNTVSALADAEEALAVFEMNLLPYSVNHAGASLPQINYLRMPSVQGAQHYRTHRSATTAAFGSTSYCGRIAILHIDGNHSYAAAQADLAAWSELVVPGGWIVVDDYVWPYGDGPQRAGDEYLQQNFDRVGVAFVMGSALFMQLAPTRFSLA